MNENLVKSFINSMNTNANSTLESYTKIISVFCEKVDVYNLTCENFANYIATFSNLTVATQKKYIFVLKEFIKWCYTIKDIGISSEINQILNIKAPRGNSKTTEPLTQSEIKKMISTSKNIRDKAIITLICVTGLRVSELINLKMSNIKEGYIEVFGKGSKHRNVYPNALAMEYLNEYINTNRAKKLKEKNIETDILFISNGGKPLLESSLNRTLKCIALRANVNKDIHPHSLRHTCATLLYDNGVGVKEIKTILGHSSITTTDKYIHLNTTEMQNTLSNVALI